MEYKAPLRDMRFVLHELFDASAHCELLGNGLEITEQDVIVDDFVLAPGYGRINEHTRTAIRLAAESEALLLDPVYSGRCMAGLLHFVEQGRVPTGSEILFVHTGGTPAIFAYQSDLSEPPKCAPTARGRG